MRPRYTTLRELLAGLEPSDLPESETTSESGPVAAPANPGQALDAVTVLGTSDTSGLRGSSSSEPVDLCSSSASKSPAPLSSAAQASLALQEALAPRLQEILRGRGSTLFDLTWKQRATPSGWRYYQLAASGRRTSVSASSSEQSWPTPTVSNADKGVRSLEGAEIEAERRGWNNDLHTAALSSWPTPVVDRATYTRRAGDPEQVTLTLAGTAQMAAWPTPLQGDSKRGEILDKTAKRGLDVPTVASWATPRAEERQQRNSRDGYEALSLQVKTASWPTPLASGAERGGQAKRALSGSRSNLIDDVQLATWPTPRSLDSTKGALQTEDRQGKTGHDLPTAASWATPAAREAGGTPEQFLERKRAAVEAGSQMGISLTSLSLQAQLTSWATPAARDWKDAGPEFDTNTVMQDAAAKKARLPGQVHLTAPWRTPTSLTPSTEENREAGDSCNLRHTRLLVSGPTLSGSPAATVSAGQLSPSMSRWLMGLPASWDACAPRKVLSSTGRSSEPGRVRASRGRIAPACSEGTATPLSPRLRPPSSARSSTPSTPVSDLKPFWRYYGGKYRAAPRYPAPLHDTIIEPFAGAAGYALRYASRKVILVEKYPVVAEMWRYLISVSEEEIRRIPLNPKSVDDLPSWVAQPARHLIGWWFNNATATTRNTLSAGRAKLADMGRKFEGWTEATRDRVASQLASIRHWQVIEGDYTCAPDAEATWFVDPPYNNEAGAHYPHGPNAIDYSALGQWCRERRGQVMVCENEGADWLLFRTFATFKAGVNGTGSREVLWTSLPPPVHLQSHPIYPHLRWMADGGATVHPQIAHLAAAVTTNCEGCGVLVTPLAALPRVTPCCAACIAQAA